MRHLAALLIALLAGCANLRDSTHAATALDAGTTVAGITSGLAVEANPLLASPAALAGMILARIAATEYAHSLPEPERTHYLSTMSSIWWGAGVSNILVLLAAATPAALAVGTAAGLMIWIHGADERLFAEICALERQENPAWCARSHQPDDAHPR